MTDPVILVIPGDPRGKGRPRFSRASGRVFTDGRTANAEGVMKVIAMEAMGERAPLEGALEMNFRAVLPIPASWSKRKIQAAMRGELMPTKTPDLDNLLKLAWDGLNSVVYLDDSQIVSVSASKEYGPQPLTAITVRPIAGDLVDELLS